MPCKVSTVIIPIFQMSKLRRKEIKEFAQHYMAGNGRAKIRTQAVWLQNVGS